MAQDNEQLQVAETMGKIAFEAYVEAVGGKNYDGKLIPKWENLATPIRQAWHQAAWAVMDEMRRRLGWEV